MIGQLSNARRRISRVGRLPGFVKLRFQFLAHDGEVSGRFDAYPHPASLDANDRNGDVVADEQPLADFAAENQHSALLCK
jgi:hypothetical protein